MKRKSPSPPNRASKGSLKRSKESLKNSKERIKPVRTSNRDSVRPPRIISKLLNLQTFLGTIRRSTDLATKLDWNLLNPDQQHAKILDLTQMVINDLFAMITSSFTDARVNDTVEDFIKTFYPVVVGLETEDNEALQRLEESRLNTEQPDGYKSFDTFGGEKAAVMLTQSMITLENQPMKVARHRTPGRPGFGVFQDVGTDLALIKQGEVKPNEPESVAEIRDLCTKIYRSTNMRYQQIAKLILRNKGEEIRRMVQMKFMHHMPQHVSLTITKLNVQNGRHQLLFCDGPDKQIDVLDLYSLKKQSQIEPMKEETMRCALSVGDFQPQQIEKHIFVGCTNGHLLRLDPVNYFVTMRVKLRKHIFCMLQIDANSILCGQLGGFLDLVRIADGEVLLSQDLRQKCGNIISMAKVKNRDHEVVLATQKGVFFANVGRGQRGLTTTQIQQLDRTGNFALGQSQGQLNAQQEASVFAQDLSQVNETETDLNKPLETEVSNPSYLIQQTTSMNASKENPLNEQEERKGGRGRKVDQDSELPATKRTKKSPNSTQQSFGTRSSGNAQRVGSKDKAPSMASSMQRTFNRRSPVKQPRNAGEKSPRDSGARSSGGASPFRGPKQSVVSAQPIVGGSITQREQYVKGEQEAMSTQERGPVVGDHSSIYMNTEEAATRMVEESHNIEELTSQRIGISQAPTDKTRALQLQRSMQSSMRSSKKRDKGKNAAKTQGDATSFGDQQSSSHDFQRQGNDESHEDGSAVDAQNLQMTASHALPYTFLLQEERYLDDLDTRCIIQFDDEKFIACVWGRSEIFVIDREKPDAVNSFEAGGPQAPSKQNLSIQLLPFFDSVSFPFAFVLSQNSLILADLRRLQAFAISTWKFKGAPHNKNQMEVFLSNEPGYQSEGINLLTLEFDGSNSCVRRLFFSPDFVQALRFLGQD